MSKCITGLIVIVLAGQSCLVGAGFDYDFNNLDTTPPGDGAAGAPLAGQDGWFQMLPSNGVQGSAYVENRGGIKFLGNDGPSFGLYWSGADARPLGMPLQYNSKDAAAVFTVNAAVGNSGVGAETIAAAGPVFTPILTLGDDPGPLIFGLRLDMLTTQPAHTYLRGVGDGDALATENTYDVKAVVDFATPTAAMASLFYRDLTTGQTDFTEDSVLRNVPIQLPGDAAYYAYVENLGGRGGAAIDDLHFSSPVPEPSAGAALVLGATALILVPRRRRCATVAGASSRRARQNYIERLEPRCMLSAFFTPSGTEAVSPIVSARTLDSSPTGYYEAETQISDNPANPLKLGAVTMAVEPDGYYHLLGYTSADGAATWGAPTDLTTLIGAFQPGYDPGIAYDANGDLFASFAVNNDLMICELKAAPGSTWQNLTSGGQAPQLFDAPIRFDKDSIAIGWDPKHGTQALYITSGGLRRCNRIT